MARIMALDIGDKRIGIAVTDPLLNIPMPYKTYFRVGAAKDVQALTAEAVALGAEKIVCGLPVNFDGSESIQTVKTAKFIEELKKVCPIEIDTVDERFTTMEASRVLIAADMRRDKRKNGVDKVAASYILENYLRKIQNSSKGD